MELQDRFRIKPHFFEQRFAYELPLIGVDLEFLAERRKEAVFCITEMQKKIGEINIGKLSGVWELETVCKVLKWHHAALKVINTKDYIIKNPEKWDEYQAKLSGENMTDEQLKQMARSHREGGAR